MAIMQMDIRILILWKSYDLVDKERFVKIGKNVEGGTFCSCLLRMIYKNH